MLSKAITTMAFDGLALHETGPGDTGTPPA